jgi:hypothetical protein
LKLPFLLSCALLLVSPAATHAAESAQDYLIFEDGASGPLPESLEFHHGSWKFSNGAMLGEQVPTEKHTATIKALMAFDQMKVEWKMKFLVPKEHFLFVAWPANSSGHAMDFTFTPDTGDFALVRPKMQDKPSAVLAKGKLTKLDTDWHEVTCIHDGPNFTLTINGVTITAADESFNRPMGPFYLNGGGFNGAKYLVKDLKVTALPGSPLTRPLLPPTPPKSAAGVLNPERINVTPAAYTPRADDILLADFEATDLGDWKATGTAFNPGVRKNTVTGLLGKRCINTYLEGDKSIGTLTSPPFAIQRKHLNFLIGGGNHPGKTGVQLLVDGKVVRTATGLSLKNPANQEVMDWQSWDVSEFAGKQAVFQIMDDQTGGWGHILVDQVFQSKEAMPASLPAKSTPSTPK